MTDRMQAIRDRLETATSGPWQAEWIPDDRWWQVTAVPQCLDERWLVCPEVATTSAGSRADADLIAHAPDDLAWLLNELTDAWAALKRVEDIAHVCATVAHAHWDSEEEDRWLDLLAVLERAALGGDES